MENFLLFESFVAPVVVVFAYYFFTVGVPLFLWMGKNYLIRRFVFAGAVNSGMVNLYAQLSGRQRVYLWVLLVFFFVMAELCVRIFFEMVVAYFDMHEYLRQIAQNSAATL